MGDPAFKKYHGKFDKPTDSSITEDMYLNCHYVYEPVDSDSIAIDSLNFDDMDIRLDRMEADEDFPIMENNEEETPEVTPAPDTPVEKPAGEATEPKKKESTEPKKKAQPQYEDVYL